MTAHQHQVNYRYIIYALPISKMAKINPSIISSVQYNVSIWNVHAVHNIFYIKGAGTWLHKRCRLLVRLTKLHLYNLATLRVTLPENCRKLTISHTGQILPAQPFVAIIRWFLLQLWTCTSVTVEEKKRSKKTNCRFCINSTNQVWKRPDQQDWPGQPGTHKSLAKPTKTGHPEVGEQHQYN